VLKIASLALDFRRVASLVYESNKAKYKKLLLGCNGATDQLQQPKDYAAEAFFPLVFY
jgi:hypothetical protein